jgi:hypothetical protein
MEDPWRICFSLVPEASTVPTLAFVGVKVDHFTGGQNSRLIMHLADVETLHLIPSSSSPRRIPLLPTMYGPPRDCKGEVWSRRQVCANVFGLYVEIVSPGHDELRAYPSL